MSITSVTYARFVQPCSTDNIVVYNTDSLVVDTPMADSIIVDVPVVDSLVAYTPTVDTSVSDTTVVVAPMVDAPIADTLAKSTTAIDPLIIDSLQNDTMIIDTISVVGGILPVIKEQRLERHFYAPIDTLEKKEVKVVRPFSEKAKLRSPLFKKDTISFNRMAMISIVAPGFGQLYNDQYKKIPILYGSLGLFATGVVINNKKYNTYKGIYEAGVASELPESELYYSHGEMTKYNSYRTAFMAGAVVTYMYYLADGISNYKGDIHPTNKATLLSALFPGAGQMYNNKYWKLPIVYGGFATFAFIVNYNGRGFTRYSTAYKLRTDGDDSTKDEFDGTGATPEQLQNTRDAFRRYRDLGIIMMAGFYILQIVDAHVDAYLSSYDVSNNLAMDVGPVIIPAPRVVNNGWDGGAIGMGIKFKF